MFEAVLEISSGVCTCGKMLGMCACALGSQDEINSIMHSNSVYCVYLQFRYTSFLYYSVWESMSTCCLPKTNIKSTEKEREKETSLSPSTCLSKYRAEDLGFCHPSANTRTLPNTHVYK